MEYSKNYVAIPPGETIREQLEDRCLSQKEFALRMCMTEKHISRLINGKVLLTPAVAIRLEDVLGLPAKFWLRLEAAYREDLERVKEDSALDDDCKLATMFPYSEMSRLGWLPAKKRIEDKVLQLRKFFEVAQLTSLDKLNIPGIAFRIVASNDKSMYCCAAWAQKARLEARSKNVAPINIAKLQELLDELRSLTVMEPSTFCPRLENILASCGISIEFLPHLRSSFLHGATFVDSGHIVLALTVRGKYADKFWFSFFHEIGHIVLGHLNSQTALTAVNESQADDFAKNILIDNDEYQKFIAESDYSKRRIIEFANNQKIAAGIVLGRLQKDNRVGFNRFNDLKQQYAIG